MRYGRAVVERALADLGVDGLEEQPYTAWASARCPLHDDVGPSFTIHMEEGGWRCYAGCGSSGDLADLVAEATGDPVEEVRDRLRTGAPTTDDALARALAEPVMRVAAASAPDDLTYEQGRAPQYIFDRGFTADTLRDWGVGYDAGLGAVVIPVYMGGKLVGLVRRLVEGEPKYKNTRFPKQGVLLGLDNLPFGYHDEIVVVEGPLDAMWLYQHGVPAVALLGSSMSEQQADLLAVHFWSVALVFDADRAGEVGALQAEQLLVERGIPRRRVALPVGRSDPQECTAAELAEIFPRGA